MNHRDKLLHEYTPHTELTLSLGAARILRQPLPPITNFDQKIISFLEELQIDTKNLTEFAGNLTNTLSSKKLNIALGPKEKLDKETKSKFLINKKQVSDFLDRLLASPNLIARDVKSTLSEKKKSEALRIINNFFDELNGHLGESMEGALCEKTGIDTCKLERILKDISEVVSIECLRFNNLSSSSQEEDTSVWQNKLESACQTNSNSFWNLSEVSFYKSNFLKDFKKLKSQINKSLVVLRDDVKLKRFAKVKNVEETGVADNLERQMEENHQRIMESFRKFEERIDSGTNSDMTNTQMKVRGVPMGMDFEERGSHMTGFHFIEIINNQTAVKSKVSRRSDLPSFNPDSRDSYNQMLTKKKKKALKKTESEDSTDEMLRKFKQGMMKYSPEYEQTGQSGSRKSDSDLAIEKIFDNEEQENYAKKLGFGFFKIPNNQSNECSSIYDSSMTHRLLDALLDDNMISDKKPSITKDFEKANFCKTTEPQRGGLKDLLSKIKTDMQKKMSIQEMINQEGLSGMHKTYETIHASDRKAEMVEEGTRQVVDIYMDSEEVDKKPNEEDFGQEMDFQSNTMGDQEDGLMSRIRKKNSSLIKSSTFTHSNDKDELKSLGDSLKKRFKRNKFGSLMSQTSNTSGNENWRSRLGEKINLNLEATIPEVMTNPKPFLSARGKIKPDHANPEITEESNEFCERIQESKETIKEMKIEEIRSPELAKNFQKRLKNLIMKPGKQEKELLKKQLVRASKANRSISRSIISQNSSFEAANENIANIVSRAKRRVLKKIQIKIKGGKPETNNLEKYSEHKIRDLPRKDIEEVLIKLCEELGCFRLDVDHVKEGIQCIVKKALEDMKDEVESPFEELVKVNITRLEESKNYLDMMEMENIELEYGMLKLSQMYNEILQTLENNGITLEMPEESGEEEKEDIKTQVVRPFSLKEFREQIKKKVQEEKNELDRNLFEIKEDTGKIEDDIGGASCLQMKSVEINLENDQEKSTKSIGETKKPFLSEKASEHSKRRPTQNELEMGQVSSILISGLKDTSNQVSPANSEHFRRMRVRGNSLVFTRSSDENGGHRISMIEKGMKVSKLMISERNKSFKSGLNNTNSSFVIDFNKETPGFKSKKMIKTVSGAIKTVDEMKEEYYTIKRFNVELLVENQDFCRLNHELNSENLRFAKNITQLKKEKAEWEAEKADLVELREKAAKFDQVQNENQELLKQNKKLVVDSKGLTDFMLMNFLKVIEDLKDVREELDFSKREFAIELQMAKRMVMKKLVPRLEEVNNNCTFLCAVNDDLEKEKSEVVLKVNMIYEACTQAEIQLMSGREFDVEAYCLRVGQICKDIFEIQENSGSQMSEKDSFEEKPPSEEKIEEIHVHEELSEKSQKDSQKNSENNQKEVDEDNKEEKEKNVESNDPINEKSLQLTERESNTTNQYLTVPTVPSQDYNKLIYSEASIESNKKMSMDQNNLMKASIERNILLQSKERMKQSESRRSNRTNDSNETNNSKYQINYDNSYMGQSSSAESEEFNNGMDLLLREYMTEKMNKKRSTLNPEGVKPPYNTEKPQEVNLNDYILKTDEVEKKEEDELNSKTEDKDVVERGGEDKISQKEEEEINSEKTECNINIELKEHVLGNESQSLSQNWPTSRNNQIDDGDLDRESGFEDIVERLIGVVCLDDEKMREKVCSIYNKMFQNGETEILGTNEEMLRSLQESLNFKNKMIECLSETEKQEIAIEALTVFKMKLSNANKGALFAPRSNYGSVKKKSKADETIEDVLVRLDRLKEENKFLVSELERQNKLGKSTTIEVENLREESEDLRRKNEELVEENSVLQQRLDLFDRENQTEMSEYNDDYNQFEPMQHRLSNNMLIIQEADEEYEIDSMMSGNELAEKAEQMILKKFDKADQLSLDNESHYSFFKDYGKSDDEQDFDTKNMDSLPEIQPKILKRRMTEKGRRSVVKDHINKYMEDMTFGKKRRSKRYRKRNTIGNVGMNLIRKKLEKSESYNVSSNKLEEFDFVGGIPKKLNKTLEEPPNSDSEVKKIKLKRLISDPLNEMPSGEFGMGESGLISQSRPGASKGDSTIITPEPMISFLSQDKSSQKKFNFSKNFEENIQTSGAPSERLGSGEVINEGSVTTYKYQKSLTRDVGQILKDLEILNVFSFSSKHNSEKVIESENAVDPQQETKKRSEHQKISFMENDSIHSTTQISNKIERLRVLIEQKDLSEVLDQKVEKIEMKLMQINEKVKSIKEQTKLTMIDYAKYKSPDRWENTETISRKKKPEFTSQFSSCRSIENSRSPEKLKGLSQEKNSSQNTPLPESQKEAKNTPKTQSQNTNRVLFGNVGKRTSRLLLREFINKNFDPEPTSKKIQSPFEKKMPNYLGKLGDQQEIQEESRESVNEVKRLELENIRLNNQLANEAELRRKLQGDIEEGKRGLESLLESMPRKVKQSPLLKMGDKHFSEILELVKFQVEEYKDAIKGFKKKSKGEFSIEADSEAEKTEDLVGTSVMNSRNPSYCGSEEEAKVEEISIKDGDALSNENDYDAKEEPYPFSKDSSNVFDWKEYGEEEDEEEDEEEINENTLNIEIPMSRSIKSEDEVSGERQNDEEQITFEEMRKKQYVIQGANVESADKSVEKENLYESSGIKRGVLLIERIETKKQEMEDILEDAVEYEKVGQIFEDIEEEVQKFVKHMQKSDFESVGMNLYKQNSQKYSNELQERLLEIEEKYKNLENEMMELQKENEVMRRTQDELNVKQYLEDDQENAEPQENNQGEFLGEFAEEDAQLKTGQTKSDIAESKEDTIELTSQRRKTIEDMNKVFTDEINEMISDLLEVIEDGNINTVEKMKVIQIFLHHTHDLLENHEQMHLQEHSNQYTTEEDATLNAQMHSDMVESGEGNEQNNEDEPELECWDEELDAMSDSPEDGLDQELVIMEDKQLTEIKEQEGSEDYNSNDPKSQLLEDEEDKKEHLQDQRDDRGYASYEVPHDRAGETGVPREMPFENNYESAHVQRTFTDENLERSYKDQINELEDEKVGLKNKNIMLNDKISFLNQKLALLETRLEEMEKSYLTVKGEKKEFRGRYEAKVKQLKEMHSKTSDLKEQIKFLENELDRTNLEVENKDKQVADMTEQISNLREINKQLVIESDLKTQELMDYSLLRGSEKTGGTPIKIDSDRHDSQQSSNQNPSSKLTLHNQFINASDKLRSKKSSNKTSKPMDEYDMRNISPNETFNLENPGRPEQIEEANDRSEFPKGFGVQQMHLEEIIDQKKKIKRLKSENYELMTKMNDIQENAKLSCFKYEEDLRELKEKLKRFTEKEAESSGYRGSSWLKKRVSSCKVENELRKKNLKISKLTGQIQKLQTQVKTLTQDSLGMQVPRFGKMQRMSSNTESKNSLYQRE